MVEESKQPQDAMQAHAAEEVKDPLQQMITVAAHMKK